MHVLVGGSEALASSGRVLHQTLSLSLPFPPSYAYYTYSRYLGPMRVLIYVLLGRQGIYQQGACFRYGPCVAAGQLLQPGVLLVNAPSQTNLLLQESLSELGQLGTINPKL